MPCPSNQIQSSTGPPIHRTRGLRGTITCPDCTYTTSYFHIHGYRLDPYVSFDLRPKPVESHNKDHPTTTPRELRISSIVCGNRACRAVLKDFVLDGAGGNRRDESDPHEAFHRNPKVKMWYRVWQCWGCGETEGNNVSATWGYSYSRCVGCGYLKDGACEETWRDLGE